MFKVGFSQTLPPDDLSSPFYCCGPIVLVSELAAIWGAQDLWNAIFEIYQTNNRFAKCRDFYIAV